MLEIKDVRSLYKKGKKGFKIKECILSELICQNNSLQSSIHNVDDGIKKVVTT